MALLSVTRGWRLREGLAIREISRRTGLSRTPSASISTCTAAWSLHSPSFTNNRDPPISVCAPARLELLSFQFSATGDPSAGYLALMRGHLQGEMRGDLGFGEVTEALPKTPVWTVPNLLAASAGSAKGRTADSFARLRESSRQYPAGTVVCVCSRLQRGVMAAPGKDRVLRRQADARDGGAEGARSHQNLLPGSLVGRPA